MEKCQMHRSIWDFAVISQWAFFMFSFLYIFSHPFSAEPNLWAEKSIRLNGDQRAWASAAAHGSHQTRSKPDGCRSKAVLFLHIPSGLLPQFIGQLSRSYNCLIFRSVTSAQNWSRAHKAITLKFPRTLIMRYRREDFVRVKNRIVGKKLLLRV